MCRGCPCPSPNTSCCSHDIDHLKKINNFRWYSFSSENENVYQCLSAINNNLRSIGLNKSFSVWFWEKIGQRRAICIHDTNFCTHFILFVYLHSSYLRGTFEFIDWSFDLEKWKDNKCNLILSRTNEIYSNIVYKDIKTNGVEINCFCVLLSIQFFWHRSEGANRWHSQLK